jgi:hypothetical protein
VGLLFCSPAAAEQQRLRLAAQIVDRVQPQQVALIVAAYIDPFPDVVEHQVNVIAEMDALRALTFARALAAPPGLSNAPGLEGRFRPFGEDSRNGMYVAGAHAGALIWRASPIDSDGGQHPLRE